MPWRPLQCAQFASVCLQTSSHRLRHYIPAVDIPAVRPLQVTEVTLGDALPKTSLVPLSWFLTTSTAFSAQRLRVYCTSLPTRDSLPFSPWSLSNLSILDLPLASRQRALTPFEGFSSPTAAPCRHGRCLLDVRFLSTSSVRMGCRAPFFVCLPQCWFPAAVLSSIPGEARLQGFAPSLSPLLTADVSIDSLPVPSWGFVPPQDHFRIARHPIQGPTREPDAFPH